MKTVVITGCNRGLGLALLKAFASEGHDIVSLNRTIGDDFDRLCLEVKQTCGVQIFPVHADLSSKESLEKAVEEILRLDRPIDVLVNNAALNICKPIFYMSYEEVENTFRTNYFAPFYLMREIGAVMIRQGFGNIINISSVAAVSSEPGGAAYDASKSALNTLTRSAAQEMAPFGVRVNAVACSVVETEMFNSMKEDVKKKILKKVALKRAATFNEITDSVLYLASGKASFITGQIIGIDGGYKV
ncbi:MAG: SDR family oxidoreductase [Bacteroidales bacterium]|nr:SDR family oxidoreductase [Bacteroidales bacterium]